MSKQKWKPDPEIDDGYVLDAGMKHGVEVWVSLEWANGPWMAGISIGCEGSIDICKRYDTLAGAKRGAIALAKRLVRELGKVE